MKVELDDIVIAISPLTGIVYAGVTNKAGTEWKHKKDITDQLKGLGLIKSDFPQTLGSHHNEDPLQGIDIPPTYKNQ